MIENDKKIYSFDLFDTVISRKVAEPKGIWGLVQYRVRQMPDIPNEIRYNYCAVRENAEILSRKNSDYEDINIDEIYNEISEKYFLTDDQVQMLKNYELEEEEKNIFPVSFFLGKINNIRKENGRVVFISDMYLYSSFLKKILSKYGLYKDTDALYLSSELRATKHSGKLFEIVLDKEKCNPYELVHVGDNKVSDCQIPRQMGIQASQCKLLELNRYEKLLINDVTPQSPNFGLVQLFAGSSRYSRLNSSDNADVLKRVMYELGACVSGPLLTAYVFWVCNTAQALGINRLYFLSRDGQVLLQIAKKIAPKDIELRYLYASRQAWRLPSIKQITESDLSWILNTSDEPKLTLSIISERIFINPEFLKKELGKKNIKINSVNNVLSSEEINKIGIYLITSSDVKLLIGQNSEKKKAILVEYLKQEGFFDGVSFGLVDIGWKGSLVNNLNSLLKEFGVDLTPVGFFLGLSCIKQDPLFLKKYAYIFNLGKNDNENIPVGFRADVIEFLVSADHGMTVGYEYSQGIYRPVFRYHNHVNLKREEFYDYRKGIDAFLEALLSQKNYYSEIGYGFELKKYVVRPLSELLTNPSYYEADVIGKYLFSSDQSEIRFRELAPKIRLYDVIMNEKLDRRYTSWEKGSIIRTGGKVVFYLKMKNMFSFYKIKNMIKRVFKCMVRF